MRPAQETDTKDFSYFNTTKRYIVPSLDQHFLIITSVSRPSTHMKNMHRIHVLISAGEGEVSGYTLRKSDKEWTKLLVNLAKLT